jgi:hypothetical protein
MIGKWFPIIAHSSRFQSRENKVENLPVCLTLQYHTPSAITELDALVHRTPDNLSRWPGKNRQSRRQLKRSGPLPQEHNEYSAVFHA